MIKHIVMWKFKDNEEENMKIFLDGLNKLKELGFDVVYGQSSDGNIGSAKTIENNNGIFIKEDNGTWHYKVILNKLSLYVHKL